MCPTTQRHFRWAQIDPICTDILHTTPTPTHTPYNTQTSYNAPPHAAISLRIPGDPLQHIHISRSAHGSLTTHNLQTSSIKHRLGQWYPHSLHKTPTCHNPRTRLTINKHTFQNRYSYKQLTKSHCHTSFFQSRSLTHKLHSWPQQRAFPCSANISISTSKLDIKQCPFNKTHRATHR